ncbi:transferase family-domain-containing protein [Xylogone sp. PMI_703]|nr:transferase family-domain-containing protein [Xylogone sp. PMI_703]
MAPKVNTVTHNLAAEVPFEATYNLSLADNIPPAINSRYLFIYSTEHEIESPDVFRAALVSRLMRSIKSFLRQPEDNVLALPQLLGKIYQNASNGRLSVKVTKTSTFPFVISTRQDVSLEDLKPDLGFPSRLLDPKVFSTNIEAIAKTDRSGGAQAFHIQVTFIKGGYVICVNKHHHLLDATATGHLVRWWFERAASLVTGDQPCAFKLEEDGNALSIHDQSSLVQLKEVPQQEHPEWKVVPGAGPHCFGFELPPPSIMFVAKHLPFIKLPPITSAIFHFTPMALKELHDSLQSQTSTRISTHDAVVALVWRCVTRARIKTSQGKLNVSESMMSLAVNGRKKLEPTLAEEYFGNAAFLATTTVPINSLIGTGALSLAEAAKGIRESIMTKATDTNLRSFLQLMAAQEKASDIVNSFKVYMGHDMLITSWENSFGSTGDLDLGCGEFQTMRLPGGNGFDGLSMVMPAFGQRSTSGLEVAIDLLQVTMDSLKTDEEWKQYAQCRDS